MGNKLNKNKDKVETYQEFDTKEAGCVDADLEEPGCMILHEVAESYYGGVLSLFSGVSAQKASTNNDIYKSAHRIANTISNGDIKIWYECANFTSKGLYKIDNNFNIYTIKNHYKR